MRGAGNRTAPRANEAHPKSPLRSHRVKVGLGCVNLGSASATSSLADQVRVVRTAIDAGVAVFDTADAYGSGASERLLGRAIRGRRNEVTIATKGGYAFRPRSAAEQRARRAVRRARDVLPATDRAAAQTEGRPGSQYVAQDFTPAVLRQRVQASLRRLGVEHIDVYQLHAPRQVDHDLLGELDDLRRSGVIGRFGVGTESADSAVAWIADPRVSVVQAPMGVLDAGNVATVVGQASAHGVDVWARGVLGGGVLATALRNPAALADDPKRELIGELMAIAGQAGIGLDELALRWIATVGGIAVTLIGMSSGDHLRRNLDIIGRPPLDASTMALVNAAVTRTAPGTHA